MNRMASEIIGYVGDSNIHDGVITKVEHSGKKALVTIESEEGHIILVQFDGVKSVKSNNPEGMKLYSLSEIKHPDNRLFVFTNWKDEDNAFLEIIAEDYKIENV